LILIATSSRADAPQRAEHKKAALARLGDGPFDGVSRTSIAGALAPDRAGDEELIDHIQAMGRRLGRDAFVRQTGLARASDTARLGDIKCPTLIVAGEHDRLRGLAQLRELHDGIAGSTLTTIAGSGHIVPLEAPDALTAAIAAWLRARPEFAAGA
jgi:pimeloyl-ACP methyl ester carboxylesterase